MAILAEGNTSAREDAGTFWVKASGAGLRDIGEAGFIQCLFEPILRGMSHKSLPDDKVRSVLQSAVCDRSSGLAPSVESFMHAYLLSLPGVEFVGHAHPIAFLSLMCLEEAGQFADQRLFPDEIVCCGAASAFVPYVDPGLPLARAVQESVESYYHANAELPKTIWLQNHGLIAVGRTTAEVMSAMLMSEKSSQVRLGALSTGRKLQPLSQEQVARIHTRPDESYRQKMLFITETH